MRIGVIGGGTVGHATARCWMEFAEVRVYDVLPERSTHGSGAVGFGKVLGCDLLFVCLPTPQNKDGLGLDVSAVEEFCRSLKGPDHDYTKKNIVIKSTVPVGTTRRLAKEHCLTNLVHSPEFLTARCAVQDAMTPARNIIGIPRDSPVFVEKGYNQIGMELDKLYRKRFPGVPIQVMNSDESEAVKLFQNSYFSVKIAFFNEVHSLATKLGLNWEPIREAMVADGRIGATHTQVPGPDGKCGFGGACLPKDLSQLVLHLINEPENFVAPLVTRAAYDRNQRDRERTV